MADLTVYIPTYKRAPLLRECLTALLDQGLSPDEFVVQVSDNASPDDTGAVVREFEGRLQVRYHRHPTGVPPLANFNRAAEVTDTPYLAFCCDDDLIAPGQLGRAMACLRRHDDGVVYASTGVGIAGLGDPPVSPLGMLLDLERVEGEPFVLRWPRRSWLANCTLHTPLTIIGAVFKLERIPDRPIFPDGYVQEGDRRLFVRMTTQGTIYSGPWVGGYLRFHGDQWSLRNEHDDQRERVTQLALDTARELGLDLEAYWVERLARASEAELELICPRLIRRWPGGAGRELVARAGVDARLGQLRRERKRARRRGGLMDRLRTFFQA